MIPVTVLVPTDVALALRTKDHPDAVGAANEFARTAIHDALARRVKADQAETPSTPNKPRSKRRKS